MAGRAALSLALALAAVGCAREDAAQPPAAAAPAARAEPARSDGAREAAGAGAPLPARGTWQLAVAGGAVSVDAFEAPRRPLLEALAQRAGFALELAPGELPPLTVRIAAQPLELALPLLVGELEYRAAWESAGGAHRLVKLSVGGARETLAGSDDASLRPGEVSASLDRALRELGDAEPAMSEEDALRQLASADPEARVRALLALEGEGEGLAALARAIAEDPDPRVRAAATVGLEDSEEFAAVQALVGALRDPHPEVVIEAIDSLEFAGDASVVPALQPLLSHSDARVRKAAADAIELLGD